jgi:hypothetical protein
LEVNGMHVLHRPHLPRAITVTLIAAMLAILLTLTLAGAVSDLGSAPSKATSPTPTAAVHASASWPGPSTSPFMRIPFSNLLTRPIPAPWSQDRR